MDVKINSLANIFDFDDSLKNKVIEHLSLLSEGSHHQRFSALSEKEAYSIAFFINCCIEDLIAYCEKDVVHVIDLTTEKWTDYSFC